MIRSAFQREHPGLRIVALAVAVAIAPAAALAGPPQPAPPRSLDAAVRAAVAVQLSASQPPAALVSATSAAPADLGSKSFFRTPAGILTLVAVAAGVGFALYSTSHDRVKSPGR